MCEFISWLEVKKDKEKHVLYLDDELIFSERSAEILKKCKDNDFLGHHAIRNVWGLKGHEGQDGQCQDFWNADQLPKELRPKLKDFFAFKKNFGKMVEKYAQPYDLRYIVANAPENEKWKGLKAFCLEKLIASLLKSVKTEVLKITVRNNLSINKLVKMAKFDGYVNPDINDRNFQEKIGPEEKNQEAILLCLNANATDKEVEVVAKHLHLQLSGVKGLLSLAIDHPNKQKEFPIVALNSGWRDPGGSRDVACLDGWDGGRSLCLGWREGGWGEDGRFLAFREV